VGRPAYDALSSATNRNPIHAFEGSPDATQKTPTIDRYLVTRTHFQPRHPDQRELAH